MTPLALATHLLAAVPPAAPTTGPVAPDQSWAGTVFGIACALVPLILATMFLTAWILLRYNRSKLEQYKREEELREQSSGE